MAVAPSVKKTKIYDVEYKVVGKRHKSGSSLKFTVPLGLFALGIFTGFLLWYDPALRDQKEAFQVASEAFQEQNRLLRAKLAAQQSLNRKTRSDLEQWSAELRETEREGLHVSPLNEARQSRPQDPFSEAQGKIERAQRQADIASKRAEDIAIRAQRQAETRFRQAGERARQSSQGGTSVSGQAGRESAFQIAHIFQVRNPGNRLEDLARHYQISMTKLKQANPTLDLQITQQGHFLRVGTQVLIPK